MTDKVKIVNLAQLCSELKIPRREGRARLRIAAKDAKKYPELVKCHAPRQAWLWAEGSKALEEAKKALAAGGNEK